MLLRIHIFDGEGLFLTHRAELGAGLVFAMEAVCGTPSIILLGCKLSPEHVVPRLLLDAAIGLVHRQILLVHVQGGPGLVTGHVVLGSGSDHADLRLLQNLPLARVADFLLQHLRGLALDVQSRQLVLRGSE